MSTFLGVVDEINDICIDYFREEVNLNASIYFLSHCHSDHMKGLSDMLESSEFNNKNDVFLYGSPITIKILNNMYPNACNKLQSLKIGPAHCLKVPNTGKEFCVTLIPAEHCPGSVMFLFEAEKRILYTGDIRLTVKEIQEFKAFKYISGNLKKIDKIYLDTTFFKKSYLNFPAREKSLEEFVNLAKEWLANPEHYIHYDLSARYGTENLIIKASKELEMPFHVSELNYKTYMCIPEMDKSVTLFPEKTRIHASCNSKEFNKVCPFLWNINPSKIRKIKTSILRWKNDNFEEGIIELLNNKHFVCYSMHCSFNELKDILYYLKPNDIYPCVLPNDKKEKSEMMNLLNEVLSDIHKNKNENSNMEYKNTNWCLPENSDEEKKDVCDPFKIFDQPVKKFKTI